MDPTSSPDVPWAELSDAALVRHIAERRPEALDQLYDRFAPTLLGLINRILRGSADAEDVLQDVFVQVWNRGGQYDPARSSVGTWLVLIARSRAIDRLRTRKVVDRVHDATAHDGGGPALAGLYTSSEAVENVLMQERRERVQRELQELPDEQRQVLEMAFYQGLTQSEIAATTGLPLGTVKTRTLLAMRKLRNGLRAEIRELL